MLQYSLICNNNLSLVDQTEMAINAGCSWLEINPSDVNADELSAIVNTCREHGIILVYKQDIQRFEKDRVHGIHLNGTDVNPMEIRSQFGGHPIIGIDVKTDTPLIPLKRADVDYIVLNGYPEVISTDTVSFIVQNEMKQDVNIPIVVSGRINRENIKPIINAGASGINIDIYSLQGPDYQASLASLIYECELCRDNI